MIPPSPGATLLGIMCHTRESAPFITGALSLVLTAFLSVPAFPAQAEKGSSPGLRTDRIEKMLEDAKTGRKLVGPFGYIPRLKPILRLGEAEDDEDDELNGKPVDVPVFKDKAELEKTRERFHALMIRTAGFRAEKPRPKLKARTKDSVDVGQKQAGVSRRAEGLERYLQSSGAGPCVIFTLYHARSKTAALSHLDAGTGTADSVALMLHKMGLERGDKIEARLIGGMEGLSEDLFLVAIKTLDRLGVDIVEVDMKLDEETPRVETSRTKKGGREKIVLEKVRGVLVDSIIIDTEDGEVYDMIGVPPEPSPEDKKARKEAYEQEHGLPTVMIPKGLLRPAAVR